MVRLVVFLLQQAFVLVQQFIIGLLYALPFVFGLLLATVGASMKLIEVALKIVFKGLSETGERASCEWTKRAIIAGFPYLWERQLKKIFYGISVLAVIGIWLLFLFAPSILIILFRV